MKRARAHAARSPTNEERQTTQRRRTRSMVSASTLGNDDASATTNAGSSTSVAETHRDTMEAQSSATESSVPTFAAAPASGARSVAALASALSHDVVSATTNASSTYVAGSQHHGDLAAQRSNMAATILRSAAALASGADEDDDSDGGLAVECPGCLQPVTGALLGLAVCCGGDICRQCVRANAPCPHCGGSASQLNLHVSRP